MAIEKTIVINADTKKAVKGVNEATKSIENNNKAVEQSTGGLSKISGGVKAFGLAFKAAGIGLIISGFMMLKEVFQQNGTVAQKMAEIFETISIVFNEVTSAVVSAYESVSKATGGFNALGKVMGGLLTLVLTPLKIAFYGIKLGVEQVQLAWEKSFFGDNDPTTIKNLQTEIRQTKQDLVEVGEQALNSGKEIGKNFVGAIKEIGAMGSAVIDNVSKISIEEANARAKQNVELANRSKLAVAQQQMLIEKYDQQAEKLRQIRDEERNSIADRIKANEDLGKTLEAQQQAMLRLADLQIQSARSDVAKSDNIENQVALIEALTNRQGVLAQIEGLRSEQLANQLALHREELELTNSKVEAQAILSNEQKRFDNEAVESEIQRLNFLKELIAEESKLELDRLQKNIDNHKEGTIARVEAENEFNARKQELANESIQIDRDLNAIRVDLLNELNEQLLEAQAVTDEEKSLLEINKLEKERAKREQELIDLGIHEEERARLLESFNMKIAEKEEEIYRRKEETKRQMALDSLSIISDLVTAFAGENEQAQKRAFKLNKAIAMSQALMSTGQAVAGALAEPSVIPGERFVKAVMAGGVGAAQVVKIAKTQFNSGSAGAGGGGVNIPSPSDTRSQPANFNVVGNSGVNQLADSLNSQPIKAYVVSGEVTSAQSLERNKMEQLTF